MNEIKRRKTKRKKFQIKLKDRIRLGRGQCREGKREGELGLEHRTTVEE